jgi:peroxiredoxin
MSELQGLQSRINEIRELDAEVVAISVDPPNAIEDMAAHHGYTFPVLSDTDLEAIDAFGVRHEGGSIEGGDLARPANFIVDREGRVVWREIPDTWRVRPRPETVLEHLRAVP